MAGADNREGFIGGKMGESFLEDAGEMELGSFGSDAQDGFAEAEDAVGGGFESLGGGIVRIAGDYDLERMIGEERGGEAVGGGEKAVLRGDACECFERFLSESVVALVASEGVQANEGDGGDGIGARCGGILKRFAANVEPAHGGGVQRAVKEAAAFNVAVAGDGEVHGFLRGGEIARVERVFVGIE